MPDLQIGSLCMLEMHDVVFIYAAGNADQGYNGVWIIVEFF